MARKGPQISKTCVICGKSFNVFPSDTKQCCSKKCGAALRTKNGKRSGFHWSLDAKIKYRESERATASRTENSKKALDVIHSLPESNRGPQNRESMVWILIDPSGNYHKVVNLLDWARKNKNLFFSSDVDDETAGMRISSGFRAIASSMRGVKSRNRPVQSYKGWRLAELPRPKNSDDIQQIRKDYDNQHL